MSRYRPTAYTSTVDESLFGSDNPNSDRSNRSRRVQGPVLANTGAAIISQSELSRIKASAVIKTEKDYEAERQASEALKEEQQKASRDRKLKMKELERKAVALAKKTPEEIRDEARKQAQLKAAKEQLLNNSDVVKLMKSMAERAIAFTIREDQIAEKERQDENASLIDKKINIQIEIDRIEDIRRKERELADKQLKRREDRKVINQQIAQNERARMLEREAREQENIAMRQTMQKYKEEDEENARLRRIHVEKSKKEVQFANAAAIERKKMQKWQEKKDMEDIIRYNLELDEKLRKREEEEAAIAAAKKERQLKLINQQEKSANYQGKLDELRARRAAEEKERLTRKKEMDEAKKRQQDMKELMEARAKQAEDKELRLQQEKLLAQEEIINNAKYMQRMSDREISEAKAKEDKARKFQRELLEQQEANVIRNKKNNEKLGGPDIRHELIKEEAELNVIRDKMISDLLAQGVKKKYLSELEHVNIRKMLAR